MDSTCEKALDGDIKRNKIYVAKVFELVDLVRGFDSNIVLGKLSTRAEDFIFGAYVPLPRPVCVRAIWKTEVGPTIPKHIQNAFLQLVTAIGEKFTVTEWNLSVPKSKPEAKMCVSVGEE